MPDVHPGTKQGLGLAPAGWDRYREHTPHQGPMSENCAAKGSSTRPNAGWASKPDEAAMTECRGDPLPVFKPISATDQLHGLRREPQCRFPRYIKSADSFHRTEAIDVPISLGYGGD